MLNIPVFVPRFLLCRAGERTEVIIGLCFLNTKSPATAVHPCVRPLSVRALCAWAHILFESRRPKNVILLWRDSSLPENTWPSKCSSRTCDLIWPWRSGCSYLLCILYPSTGLANHFLNNCQPENLFLSGLRVLDFCEMRSRDAGVRSAAGSMWSSLSLQAEQWMMGNPSANLTSALVSPWC